MKLIQQETILANGLQVLTCAMPHAYSVGVGFYVSVGSRYEDDALAGAAHFIEHMLFKGSRRYPSPQAIAAIIEGHGGLFNASTGRESTVLWVKMQQAHLGLTLDVLSDMLRASLMPADEMEKERRVILEEISSSLDVPEELVSLIAHEITWPGHPLGRDVAGTPESISQLTLPGLQSFMASHYAPQNIVLSMAGDVQHEQVVELAVGLLGDWQPTPPTGYNPAPPDGVDPVVSLTRRSIEQTHLTLHLPGMSRDDPDRYVLGLLNVILGEGMSSRLFLEIRERLGLAYAVDSYLSFLADTGLLGIYAAVAPEQAGPALEAVLAQLRRLREEAVEVETLQIAKEAAKGRLLLGMEDTLSVASWFGRQKVLGGPVLAVEEVLAHLDVVAAGDIQRVAQRLFTSRGARLAMVGPHRKQDVRRFRDLLAGGLA